jgi:exosortase E/protease (VPEID-CTERM system)
MAISRLGLGPRVVILGILFILEKVLLNQFIDFELTQTAQGFGAFVRESQHLGFRFLVALIAAISLFAYVQGGQRLREADQAIRRAPIRLRWALAHVVMIGFLIPLSYSLYRESALPFGPNVALWLIAAAAAGASAVTSMAPWRLWRDAAASLGNIWWYAGIAALLSAAALRLSQRLWETTATITFHIVRFSLTGIFPALHADASTRILQTSNFALEVSQKCSGLEGVGLILAFLGAWLLYFRREFVFPRALLLIPLGVGAVFILNALRIALLIVIGDAGFVDVAVYGFHSQAGWIIFIGVACGLVLLSRRSRWLNRTAVNLSEAPPMDNPTAAYLMPLLAILAAGMVSKAFSGSFEYLYLLRIIAALWIFVRYRNELLRLNWHWSWRGVAVGLLVFLIWTAAARQMFLPAHMPDALAALPGGLKEFWILARIVGSVLMVPLAEELAYRGYLMRRLTRPDFESVPYSSVSWLGLMSTAVLFGMMHGEMWIAGIIAGLAYGLIAKRTGLGESVAAHAVTNALIAASVLAADQWQLW